MRIATQTHSEMKKTRSSLETSRFRVWSGVDEMNVLDPLGRSGVVSEGTCNAGALPFPLPLSGPLGGDSASISGRIGKIS